MNLMMKVMMDGAIIHISTVGAANRKVLVSALCAVKEQLKGQGLMADSMAAQNSLHVGVRGSINGTNKIQYKM